MVEVDHLRIEVVDDFYLGWRLGKEDSSPAEEGFTVEIVFGDERQDGVYHRLLTTVIRNGCFHGFCFFNG